MTTTTQALKDRFVQGSKALFKFIWEGESGTKTVPLLLTGFQLAYAIDNKKYSLVPFALLFPCTMTGVSTYLHLQAAADTIKSSSKITITPKAKEQTNPEEPK